MQSGPFDAALVFPQAAPVLACVRVSAGYGPHKLTDRSWLAQIESLVPAGTRPLLVAPGDTLLETTRANVFVVRDGELSTPPLDGEILPGVMRSALLAQARRTGIPAREAPIAVDELAGADAILLTGSLRLVERMTVRGGRASEQAIAELERSIAALAGVDPDTPNTG